MEKIDPFLPSISIISFITAFMLIYLKLIFKHFGDNFKSVEWQKNNKWKVAWLFASPGQYLAAPVAEELIFRAPIIVAFSTISSSAWYGIWVSAVLFAVIHWFGPKISAEELILEQEKHKNITDDVVTEAKRISQKASGRVLLVRFAHTICVLPLGILAGYYGIKYQSIWVSCGIHATWNIFMPVLVMIFLALIAIVIFCTVFLWNKTFGMLRKLWRHRQRQKWEAWSAH